ncbi:hypothetical protein SAMN06265222_1238 [Neorhodopirellula lusitana]|uniref:Uncharacterized protein n=1 Tax=Neorhodopirellula lusitana TaxID=445327 RepID=A0ABY1QRR9_9BACT|nr:hypothetical protein SAMN06265222_1238 [Neorhodopirellula lusitana]
MERSEGKPAMLSKSRPVKVGNRLEDKTAMTTYQAAAG